MNVYIENAVPLKELAAVTKRSVADVEAEALELGLFLGCDWAGLPAIGERDARQIVSGEARRIREGDAEWAAHLAECSAWTAARDEAVQGAYKQALAASRRRGPEGDSQARDAAVEAGRRYEKATPIPLWQGTDSHNAVRSYSPEPAGLIARTVKRVKAGAR